MKKKHSNRVWYVYSTDGGHTNGIIFRELNVSAEHDCTVEDIDSAFQKVQKTLNLARLNSYDEVKLLKRGRQNLRINFNIFVQDDPGGKIYRWPFDEGTNPVLVKPKSRRK